MSFFLDALWDLPGSFTLTGPNNTASIFATYPGKHLTLVNGFFDQVRLFSSRLLKLKWYLTFLHNIDYLWKVPDRLTRPSTSPLCRSLELRLSSSASWRSWTRTTTPSLRAWRPSPWASWFWSLDCPWASTPAMPSILPETWGHVSSLPWLAGAAASSRESSILSTSVDCSFLVLVEGPEAASTNGSLNR